MTLTIRTLHEDQRVRLVLAGEIDYATAPRLRAAISAVLNRGTARRLVLDLRDVTLLDSVGIATLVAAHRICEQIGTRLHVRSANPFVTRTLRLVGIADMLDLEATVEIRTPA